MKTVIVYDSKFGNTERVARAIAEELGTGEPVAVVAAGSASEQDLAGVELLAIGGPTQAHGMSPALRAFVESIPSEAVWDVPTVTFDTRLTWPRFLAGSAAAASAKRLAKLGAQILVPPESFLVQGSEGPLVEGEIERVHSWARSVRTAVGVPEPAGTVR